VTLLIQVHYTLLLSMKSTTEAPPSSEQFSSGVGSRAVAARWRRVGRLTP